MTSKPYRRDALPEFVNWRDTGCSVSPSCLECPLAQCRYDVHGGARVILNVSRDQEWAAAHAAGESARAIARRTGVHVRTVYRALALSRGGLGGGAGPHTHA